ncbi:MAG: hypothetical protein CIT01_00705 [Methanobacterium sp. BRmetb2]|nr:MAG: hypothetical protein CIT01_00705 [Methanobacterium sp. BRmetb2]
MKKEVRLLLEKSINSLILSIEHFNRPWDRGRVEAVLILLDHSFELLLKATIVHEGGKINKKGQNETIGFDSCVRKAISHKIITNEQALTPQTINGLRDAAQHYIVEISEQQLYMHSQSGLTLYKDILKGTFQKNLSDELPVRVLPVSTTPPLNINTLFENELKEVKKLLIPGTRRKKEATVKLRALSIFDRTLRGETFQPSERELNKLADDVKQDKDWNEIFPGVASINLTLDGIGHNLSLRITKKEDAPPVQLVPEGTPGAAVVAVRRVNELDFYNLSHKQLAKKVGLTSPRTTAIIKHMKLRDDYECYNLIKIGKTSYHRYSQYAIHKIKEELKTADMDKIWKEYRAERYDPITKRRIKNE